MHPQSECGYVHYSDDFRTFYLVEPSGGRSNIDKVDSTMDSIREQMDLTNEISDAISNPVGMGNDLDEVSVFVCYAAWRLGGPVSRRQGADWHLLQRVLCWTAPPSRRVQLYSRKLLSISGIIQDELKNELEEMEQAELNERLVGADAVPVHTPAPVVSAGPSRIANGESSRRQQQSIEDDDDAELRALQAELAM